MTGTRCEEFMRDPERFASHAGECPECRMLVEKLELLDRHLAAGRLEVPSASPAIARTLPLAAWEGARFRSWPVAVASAVAILSAAIGVFAILGVPPLAGVFHSISGQLAHSVGYVEATRHVAGMLRSAPTSFHLAVGAAFLAVNALFFYLLRRAPKGIDVSSR